MRHLRHGWRSSTIQCFAHEPLYDIDALTLSAPILLPETLDREKVS